MSIYHPEAYHGGKPPFFEGWYFKMGTSTGDRFLVVIPGVFLGRKGETAHSFVQVYDVRENRYHYIRYPQSTFSASKHRLEIRVGENLFTPSEIKLQIEHPELSLTGTVRWKNHFQWPVKALYPGTMGLTHFAPFMQTYYHVVDFNPSIDGTLQLNGMEINFDSGKGYIEKNWGREFPAEWIWFQSNHFEDPTVSLVFSVASIPVLGMKPRGLLIGLYAQGRFYHWSSLRFHKILQFQIENNNSFLIHVSGLQYGIRISGRLGKNVLMNAPTTEDMVPSCRESLHSSGHFVLYRKNGRNIETIYEDSTSFAGMEMNGEVGRLLE